MRKETTLLHTVDPFDLTVFGGEKAETGIYHLTSSPERPCKQSATRGMYRCIYLYLRGEREGLSKGMSIEDQEYRQYRGVGAVGRERSNNSINIQRIENNKIKPLSTLTPTRLYLDLEARWGWDPPQKCIPNLVIAFFKKLQHKGLVWGIEMGASI